MTRIRTTRWLVLGLAFCAAQCTAAEGPGLENVRACLEPMGAIRPCLPVPGGSDWAGTLEGVHGRLGTVDFGFVPGRGVFGHPMGPAAGAASLRQAWDAIARGVPPRGARSRTRSPR